MNLLQLTSDLTTPGLANFAPGNVGIIAFDHTNVRLQLSTSTINWAYVNFPQALGDIAVGAAPTTVGSLTYSGTAILAGNSTATPKLLGMTSGIASWVSVPTGGTGTVTSVGVGTPSIMTASAAVTGAGTITISLTVQAANTWWMGPISGSDAAPTFRKPRAADLISIVPITITGGTAAIDASVLLPNSVIDIQPTVGTTTFTISNPTGAVDGQKFLCRIKQPSGGNCAIVLDTKFTGNADLTLPLTPSTTGSVYDLLAFYYFGATDHFWVTGFERGNT